MAAEAADRRRHDGRAHGPLDGVPVAIKDLQETAGIRTTYGCAEYADNVPEADAPSVARLREAGMVIIGKTSTAPWGTLGETKHRLGPPACNPVDQTRTAGGSSGGSAAAVASGIVPLATGTDSAGSVTAPAAFCGIIGIRPTRGAIANPPDQESLLRGDVGILARTPLDAALALDAMIGFDPADPHSIRTESCALAAAVRVVEPRAPEALAGLRVLVCADPSGFAVEPSAADACLRTAAAAAELGAQVTAGQLPIGDPMGLYMALYGTDLRLALGSDPAAYSADIYPETHQDLLESLPLSAEQYIVRLNELWRLQAAADRLFEIYDLVLTPATATASFPHDEPPEVIGGRPVRPGWVSFMPFSVTWNMTGNPTCSLPAGHDGRGLPLGTLVVGRRLGERAMLRFVAALGG